MPRPITVTYRISPTPAAVAQAAAKLFADAAVAAVQARGRARIAISGGTTPKAMFALLADPAQPFFKQVPWAKLDLYWVDERCVPPTDADSNYRMTNEALLSKVPLAPERIHRMEGELDPAVAAARYESTIRNTFRLEGAETPTFDLVLLGMGDDGHTASLFPHTEAINDLTDIVTANHVPQKDTWRITLTWPVINQGREVAFLIEGAGKAQVLHDVLLGPYQPDTYPSQIIRPASGQLTLLLDSAAASKLPAPNDSNTAGTLELK
ncbi:6-phosphogluconolactonase [Edaphobacter dinghuensis]|uniref:6-phosphogluconolactonase n=1 Tax=Edaphobacter dinghuensis TaxID=1560005 RepID=A0A917LY86_9BACT|nr:6-phosphogluconolactonase [Edaphobacter dinghuensis]GGG63626.1 6-phosphogluconolactonase [Edaphobacter dinghuensis]